MVLLRMTGSCCAATQGGCSSREDGLPSPGSSGGQIIVRVVAARAVWLLSPVDSWHQGNLQQSSKHGAHNLHAICKGLLNRAVPCQLCCIDRRLRRHAISSMQLPRASKESRIQGISLRKQEVLLHLSNRCAALTSNLQYCGRATFTRWSCDWETCLRDDVDERSDPVKEAGCNHCQGQRWVEVPAANLQMTCGEAVSILFNDSCNMLAATTE